MYTIREQALDVVDEKAQEEGLVVVLDTAQEHVTCKITRSELELRAHPVGAYLDRFHVGRQQTVQSEPVTLLDREGRALVQVRTREQIHTVNVDSLRQGIARHTLLHSG